MSISLADHLAARKLGSTQSALQTLLDPLAPAIAKALSEGMGFDCACDLGGIMLVQAADWAVACTDGYQAAVRFGEDTRSIVSLSKPLVWDMLDDACGGSQRFDRFRSTRALEKFEHEFARAIAGMVVAGLAQTAGLDCRDAELGPPVAADDLPLDVSSGPMLAVAMIIRNRPPEWRLCFLFSAMRQDMFRALTVSGITSTEDVIESDWRVPMERNVAQVDIVIQARLRARALNLSSLMSLQTGDILPLDSELIPDVNLVVEGQSLFAGKLGRNASCLTVKIVSQNNEMMMQRPVHEHFAAEAVPFNG